MRHYLVCTLLVGCLWASGWAQSDPASPSPSEPAKASSSSNEPDVEFIDSKDAYWVNKGFNDTLFYGAPGGSVNAVRLERDQFRSDDVLRKIYKPPQGVEVKGSNKTAPVLKMGGKESKTP